MKTIRDCMKRNVVSIRVTALFVARHIGLLPVVDAQGRVLGVLGLPRAAVLVSIRRGDEIIIPRGDTRLRAGDVVTALCEQTYIEEVRNVLNAPADSISGGRGE